MTTRESNPSFMNNAGIEAPLVKVFRIVAFVISYVLITFGQPAFSASLAPFAAIGGFSLFFLATHDLSCRARFWSGFCYFFSVQAVQLWWFTSHPFYYIWAVYFILCSLMGAQFGLLAAFASKKMLSRLSGCLFLASVWTLLEWSRLFWFSGFYFDLIGQYLIANTTTLQLASVVGTLGLSFWVMLTNCLVASVLVQKFRVIPLLAASIAAGLPFFFGTMHLQTLRDEQRAFDALNPPLSTLIVHGKKVPDEMQTDLLKNSSPLERAFDRWKEVLHALAPFKGQKYDFILMPEVIVPFSSTSLIYPKELVNAAFEDAFKMPFVTNDEGEYVCSEDIAKALTEVFGCPVIIGLEGTQPSFRGERQKFFNSAFCFTGQNYPCLRYDKQILVPMGEYIPFAWAKSLAMSYGIADSFTPGKNAKLFCIGRHRVGPSICYEETFSNLMRQNSLMGATVLVNLTDDYWFPFSQLGVQHFEHARARTVENGVPLIRACNFGISGAVNSLGETVVERVGLPFFSAFSVTLSAFHYKTLYSILGDWPVLILSGVIVLGFSITRMRKHERNRPA